MRKRILAVSLVTIVRGVLVFLLVRAESTIERQKVALRRMSAQIDVLQHAPRGQAPAPPAIPGGPRQSTAQNGGGGNNGFITIPGLEADKAEIERLVENGVASYEAGNLDAAEVALDQALRDDPGNHRARYFLNLIKSSHLASNNRFRMLTNGAKGTVIFAPRIPDAGHVPRGWIPFEFNGETYYRIPLALSK